MWEDTTTMRAPDQRGMRSTLRSTLPQAALCILGVTPPHTRFLPAYGELARAFPPVGAPDTLFPSPAPALPESGSATACAAESGRRSGDRVGRGPGEDGAHHA